MKSSLLFLVLFYSYLLTGSANGVEKIDLSGPWKIRLDSKDIGLTDGWAEKPQGVDGELPGIVTEAGLGEKLELKPSLTKKVFEHLHQKRSYIGTAWFYKEFEIESTEQFKNATLYLERVLWTSHAWINGKKLGSQNSLCVPHVYDCANSLRAGKNLIAIRIDNRPHVDLGTYGHAYTQQTQTIWNGIVGSVEIQPKSSVSIAHIRVAPQTTPQSKIEVKLFIDNSMEHAIDKAIDLKIRDQGGTEIVSRAQKSVLVKPGRNTVSVQLDGKGVKAWSEFSPVLYELTCQMDSSKTSLTTGFRTVETDGQKLTINNRVSFMRGTLDCCIFPKTGYPPTNSEHWTSIFQTLKEHGLNHVRFHSWCPPEAAFVAADKMGIYLQPELPNWTAKMGQDPTVDHFLEQEGERILREYSHHPSFVFFSLGNELTGDLNFLDKMIAKLRMQAPHLLYTSTSYSFSKRGLSPGPEDDFFISQKTKAGWVRGQGFLNDVVPNTDRDYSKGLTSVDVPLITHEVGQYCVFPNLAEISKYDGNLVALNFQAIQNDLKRKGRLGRAKELTDASGKLAALLYKEDIERALRTPGLSGIQLLGMQDFSGQSTATVGVLDAFWDSKGVVSSEQFRRFCSPVVPLLKTRKRIWTNEETFSATVELANFSESELREKTCEVEVVDSGNKPLFRKSFPVNVPLGNGYQVGEFEFPLQKILDATKLTIRCRILETDIENSWNIWCYPSKTPELDRQVRQFVVHREVDDEFASDVAGGKRILLLAGRDIINDPLDGRFVPVFWSPLHFPNQPGALGALIQSEHPAFNFFPTDSHTNWQWWELFSNSTSVNATALGSKFNPIVSFVDKYNRNAVAACISEFKIGASSILVCTLDIETVAHERIGATQLKKSLFAYLNSTSFNPSFECTIDQFSKLFRDKADRLVANAADGNLANRLQAEPYYWSGTRRKIENRITKSLDTELVGEESTTNLGYVCDVAIEKDMVYTAKFRLGQFGGKGYKSQPIRLYIKARKSGGRWVEAAHLDINDMPLAKDNKPGKYNEYQLTFAANENAELIGFDEILLQIAEVSPNTQGYIGTLSFDVTKEESNQPNVLLILADDLGWKDLGCYGSTFHETPSCDRLASEGVRFTDAYAAAPVCSPTRISILTGKYPARLATTEYFGCPTPEQWRAKHKTRRLPAEINDRLELGEQTIAETMRARGYRTFFAGKWHCGDAPFWPQYQGFEINVGGWTRGGPYGGDKYFSPYGNPMMQDGPKGEHLPDRLANETIDFIEANSDRPFFAFLSLYSVHTPLMSREDLQKKYERKRAASKLVDQWEPVESVWDDGTMNVRTTQDHAVYAAMVEAMDQAVGKVLATLDRLLLSENTIVIFVSDNGGLSTSGGKWVPTTCKPLRTGKGWLYEGGLRVPMLVKWPSKIPAGKVVRSPVITNDLFETLQSLRHSSTIERTDSDGIDLINLLEEETKAERALYWHYPHYGNQGGFPGAVIRKGNWKLIQNFDTGQVELYNLYKDIGEQNNRSSDLPKICSELLVDLEAWKSKVKAKPTTPNPNSKY